MLSVLFLGCKLRQMGLVRHQSYDQTRADQYEFLLSGIGWTIAITICCVIASIVVGFALYLLWVGENRWLRLVYRGTVEVLRSIPPLVSILWVYYGLPVLTGWDFNPFVSGVFALSLYGAAFMAEIYRGGAVDRARSI